MSQPNRRASYHAISVTASDTADLATVADGIMVATTAGDVAVITENGTTVTLKTVPLVTVIPLRVARVKSTGTAAVGVLALYLPTF